MGVPARLLWALRCGVPSTLSRKGTLARPRPASGNLSRATGAWVGRPRLTVSNDGSLSRSTTAAWVGRPRMTESGDHVWPHAHRDHSLPTSCITANRKKRKKQAQSRHPSRRPPPPHDRKRPFQATQQKLKATQSAKRGTAACHGWQFKSTSCAAGKVYCNIYLLTLAATLWQLCLQLRHTSTHAHMHKKRTNCCRAAAHLQFFLWWNSMVLIALWYWLPWSLISWKFPPPKTKGPHWGTTTPAHPTHMPWTLVHAFFRGISPYAGSPEPNTHSWQTSISRFVLASAGSGANASSVRSLDRSASTVLMVLQKKESMQGHFARSLTKHKHTASQITLHLRINILGLRVSNCQFLRRIPNRLVIQFDDTRWLSFDWGVQALGIQWAHGRPQKPIYK